MSNKFGFAFIILLCFLTGCGKQDYKKNAEEYNLDLKTITIELEGVAKEKDYLFFSDNQAAFDGRQDLGWFGTADNRSYTDDAGIPAADNFDHFIEFANTTSVDGVICGGDLIDYGSKENQNILQLKLNQLKSPYIYTYGNHDSYLPWENRFDDESKDFLALFQGEECEFQCIKEEEYNIVAIRNYQKDGTANISKLALNEFKKTYEEQKPILLVLHVPIVTENMDDLISIATENQGDIFRSYDAGEFGTVNQSRLMGYNCGYELTEESKEFLELVLDENSPVIVILAGHLHEEYEGNVNSNIREYVVDGAYKNKGILVEVK